MLTPIHIIRMAPISLEFTKEQTVAYSNFAKNAKKAKKVSTSEKRKSKAAKSKKHKSRIKGEKRKEKHGEAQREK